MLHEFRDCGRLWENAFHLCVCCQVFLKFLKLPYYAKQFLLINTFQKLYYPLVRGWLFVPLLENWVEIAVGKRVNIGDEVLSFRDNLVFSTIHRINDYPVVNAIYFPDTSLRVN